MSIDYDSIDKRNDEEYAFAKELESKGHVCVAILESMPVQVSWCRQDTCNGSKYGFYPKSNEKQLTYAELYADAFKNLK